MFKMGVMQAFHGYLMCSHYVYTDNLLLDDVGIERQMVRDVTMINVHPTGDNSRYANEREYK